MEGNNLKKQAGNTKVYLVLFLVLVAAIVIVAFGMRKDKAAAPSSSEKTVNTGSGQEEPTNTGAANEVSAKIENLTFSPNNISVKAGMTVSWTNLDSVSHTVTADTPSADAPASGTLSKGDSYSFKFTKAGAYKYHCNFHGGMTGTVTVTE